MKSATLRKKDLMKNDPISYGEFASERKSYENDYLDTLADQSAKKLFKDSNYGAEAERLAQSGLSSSGYEDYLKGVLERRSQSEKNNAERERFIGKYETKSDYSKYISDYERLQNKISEGLIQKIGIGQDFSFENAFNAAVDAGLAEENAYYTAIRSVNTAKSNAVKSAVEFAKENKLTPKRAKEYALKLGLDEIYAEEVYKTVYDAYIAEKSTLTNMNSDEYYNYIKSQYK